MWKKVNPSNTFIVQVSLKDKVVGFARLVDDGQMGMIYDVCVLPDFQKKKTGSMIMSRMAHYLKENSLSFVGLVVAHENPTARFFYQKFGFKGIHSILQRHQGE